MIRDNKMSSVELLVADVNQMVEAQEYVERAMSIWAELNQYRQMGLGGVDKEFWKIGDNLGAMASRICNFREIYEGCIKFGINMENSKDRLEDFKYRKSRFRKENRWIEFVDRKKIECDKKAIGHTKEKKHLEEEKGLTK